MQDIPEIIENRIAPPNPSSNAAPTKKPTVPATAITITDTAVLDFFITAFLHRLRFTMTNYIFLPLQ